MNKKTKKNDKEKQNQDTEQVKEEQKQEETSRADTAAEGKEENKKKNKSKSGGEQKEERELTPEEKIEDLQQKLTEAEEKYVRAKAELDNYKKRMQKEFAEVRTYTKANTIEQFLSVFDHFQMAMDHMGETPDIQTLKQGMDMIYNELGNTFQNLGVKKIDAEGVDFDPAEHEAMAEEHSDDVPAGKVLRQWKCGYRLGERLIRPATVVVSKGPEEEPSSEEEPQASEEKEKEKAEKSGE